MYQWHIKGMPRYEYVRSYLSGKWVYSYETPGQVYFLLLSLAPCRDVVVTLHTTCDDLGPLLDSAVTLVLLVKRLITIFYENSFL